MQWLKEKYLWVIGALVAVIGTILGLLVAIVTFGSVRPQPKPRDRPKTPDVNIPDPVPINVDPADEYEEAKIKEVADVEASINSRYK